MVKKKIMLILTICLILMLSSNVKSEIVPKPVIGILAQEFHDDDLATYYKGHKSYIAASYVKAVEASGALVVPIKIGQTQEYYQKLMSQLNGVLIPGGAAWFNDTNGYKDAGNTIYHIAEKMNNDGIHFPILGVCLGFELLLFISNNEKELRTKCSVYNKELSLKFEKKGSKKGIYTNFPHHNLKALEEPISYNYHIWCITKETMKRTNLTDQWDILADSKYKDFKFVATVHNKKYPFAGIQFHPEKNAYEWYEHLHIDHSRTGLETARLFYDWLAVEAGRNNNQFVSIESLYKEIIYNYPAVMTYPNVKAGFQQIYFFD